MILRFGISDSHQASHSSTELGLRWIRLAWVWKVMLILPRSRRWQSIPITAGLLDENLVGVEDRSHFSCNFGKIVNA